jgi:hypothetical protein
MALLSFSPTPAKGATSTATLDKSELMALPAVSGDAYWSDASNAVKAYIIMSSTVGNQEKTLVFDLAQASPTSPISFSLRARDTFQLDKIILMDADEGELVLERAALLAATPGLSSVTINL